MLTHLHVLCSIYYSRLALFHAGLCIAGSKQLYCLELNRFLDNHLHILSSSIINQVVTFMYVEKIMIAEVSNMEHEG